MRNLLGFQRKTSSMQTAFFVCTSSIARSNARSAATGACIQDKLSYRDGKRGVTSYLFNAACLTSESTLDDTMWLDSWHETFDTILVANRPEIRRTFETKPQDFCTYITIDDHLRRFHREGQIATLINPSVVNGAQTLYAVSSSARKIPALSSHQSNCARSAHVGPVEDDLWLQTVIRG